MLREDHMEHIGYKSLQSLNDEAFFIKIKIIVKNWKLLWYN